MVLIFNTQNLEKAAIVKIFNHTLNNKIKILFEFRNNKIGLIFYKI